MVSKQAGTRGTVATRADTEDPPSKDHRVAGKGPRLFLLYKKATSKIPGPWDKEDLLDVLYWLRQLTAILAGVAWGLVPLTGLYAFLGYMALCLGAPFLWYQSQRIDEEEFGGHQQLAGEGLAPSAALFVLVWIITYTFAQF